MTRSHLKIYGRRAIKGEVNVSGAKNSALPLLFASILAEGNHQFENAPNLRDVQLALKMLCSLGCSYRREGSRLAVKNSGLTGACPCPESAKSFRASVLCLGPLLSRFKKAQIPLPGGCAIGSRPIDIHLNGLKKMGADIFVKEGCIYGSAPADGLKASEIYLDFPSVGATENLILASVLAQGTSYLRNTACEPEITDLINYLKSMGAQIEQKGRRKLKIIGVPQLSQPPKAYEIIPDRIEAGTWLLAGACAKGEVLVKKCRPEHLTALLEKLKQTGCAVQSQNSEIFLSAGGPLKAVDIKTGVYPSFPTDLQSQFMALMTQLEGLSSLEETVFEDRFRYIKQLNFLSAGIQIKKRGKAFVKGPVFLKGNDMEATDLRAGAGLVLAALAAAGDSRLYGLNHIERGYENFVSKLQALNARVQLCG